MLWNPKSCRGFLVACLDFVGRMYGFCWRQNYGTLGRTHKSWHNFLRRSRFLSVTVYYLSVLAHFWRGVQERKTWEIKGGIFRVDGCHTPIFDPNCHWHVSLDLTFIRSLTWSISTFQWKFRQRGILKYLIFDSESGPLLSIFIFWSLFPSFIF